MGWIGPGPLKPRRLVAAAAAAVASKYSASLCTVNYAAHSKLPGTCLACRRNLLGYETACGWLVGSTLLLL
eukprot:3989153-Pyramimonas_sp.AAC.1